ncbi:hypothetical protein AN958_10546 [Leucoagaricus sp. SymC.cos]|nr:hypothetical protein AN958_10546 [Leucoagaricus sp. SymC.cos]
MPFPFSLPHIEDCEKRIRAYKGGACLIDTYRAKLVWEHPRYPTYFFPDEDLPHFYLQLAESTPELAVYNITAGDEAAGALTRYYQTELAGLFTVRFSAMDSWFEENEEIFVHPKDPYKRIDVLRSSKHIRIEVDGTEVANTQAPYLLFETGLPIRYYVSKTDCRLDFLEPSGNWTQCPYKGEAQSYHIHLSEQRVFQDIAWCYPSPILEVAAIRGLVAFYNEKVDIWIDGVKQLRPVTRS